jgi:hypothetical protein
MFKQYRSTCNSYERSQASEYSKAYQNRIMLAIKDEWDKGIGFIKGSVGVILI